MAKEKDTGSKSEVIPGGVKASDLPTSVGGTAVLPPTPNQAPVTTDAAAVTPPTPSRPDVCPPCPGEDAAECGPQCDDDRKPPRRVPAGFTTIRNISAGMTDPADEISVKDLIGLYQQFVADAKAENWGALIQDGSNIMGVFAHLIQTTGLLGVSAEDAKALECCPRLAQDLSACRTSIASALQSGAHVEFHGSGHNKESGSPPPRAAVKASSPTAINPQSLLVLYELVMQIWNMFQSKTNS